MYLWWNRCEKCQSAYGDHQSGTTSRTDCCLLYDWSEIFRENLFLQDCCFQFFTRVHVCEIYLRNIMPYFIIARVLFSRMPSTREAASLIKPDLQKEDMPTPRLPDNSDDAFGILISVKPNTSTVTPQDWEFCLYCGTFLPPWHPCFINTSCFS